MCDFKFIDPGPCPERFFHWLSISVFHFWWLIELSYWFKAVFFCLIYGEFFPHKVKKIILHKINLIHERSLKKLEFPVFQCLVPCQVKKMPYRFVHIKYSLPEVRFKPCEVKLSSRRDWATKVIVHSLSFYPFLSNKSSQNAKKRLWIWCMHLWNVQYHYYIIINEKQALMRLSVEFLVFGPY